MNHEKKEETTISVQLSTGDDFHIDVDAHTRTIDALLCIRVVFSVKFN